jgi:hypothetical protein
LVDCEPFKIDNSDLDKRCYKSSTCPANDISKNSCVRVLNVVDTKKPQVQATYNQNNLPETRTPAGITDCNPPTDAAKERAECYDFRGLLGNKSVIVEGGTTFTDPGVVMFDAVDGIIPYKEAYICPRTEDPTNPGGCILDVTKMTKGVVCTLTAGGQTGTGKCTDVLGFEPTKVGVQRVLYYALDGAGNLQTEAREVTFTATTATTATRTPTSPPTLPPTTATNGESDAGEAGGKTDAGEADDGANRTALETELSLEEALGLSAAGSVTASLGIALGAALLTTKFV